MSARYTSPELSRRLREAGLSVYAHPREHYHYAEQGRLCSTDGCGNLGDTARALRLDEVLEEFKRLMKSGALVTWRLEPANDVHGNESYLCSVTTRGGGLPPSQWNVILVEAAGLVLCQLLEARR